MCRPSRAHRHRIHPTLVPGESCSRAPVWRSHTATVLSSEPETTCRPSGLTATELTAPWCPVSVQPLAGLEVPHRHGPVVGAGDDVPAVGAHRHRNSPHLDAR